MSPTLVVVGSSNSDLTIQLPAIPAPGEAFPGGDVLRALGGKGANQAVAAARLGGKVTFVTCLGVDDLGNACLAGLQIEGMDLKYVKRDPDRPSGVALIFVDPSGQNAIGVAPGANNALTAADVAAAEDAFRSADVALVQLEVPIDAVLEAVRLGRIHNCRVILNPAPAPSGPLPPDLLERVDVLTPNQQEARALVGPGLDTGESARRLRALGVGAVVMTLGAQGSLVLDDSGETFVPGRPVTAIDATGAGDCFSGALAVALGEGMGLADAARWATVAASISVTRLGAMPSLPTRAEVEAAISRLV